MKGDFLPSGSSVCYWSAIAASVFLVGWALRAGGAPSPPLFAGVLIGLIAAVSLPKPTALPGGMRKLSLALVGVGAGAMVDRTVLAEAAQRPLAIIAGVAGTIVITLVAGQVLRLSPYVDGPTAMLASIAGGASGVSAVAREMRADEGIVLSVQYLRVLFVVVSVPFVANLLGADGAAQVAQASPAGWWGLGFTAVAASLGLLLSRYLPFTAAGLVLPMAVAIALSLSQWMPSSTVPRPVLDFAYGLSWQSRCLEQTDTGNGGIGRDQPAEVLVRSLVTDTAVGRTFELFAARAGAVGRDRTLRRSGSRSGRRVGRGRGSVHIAVGR